MANPIFDGLGVSPGDGATDTLTSGQTVTWTHVITAPTAALVVFIHSDHDINTAQYTFNDFGLGAATEITGSTYPTGTTISCKAWGWMDAPAGNYTISVTVPNSGGTVTIVLASLSYSQVAPGANWRDTSGEGFADTTSWSSGQWVIVMQNPTGQYGDTVIGGMTYLNTGAASEWDSGQTSRYAYNAGGGLFRLLASERPGTPAMELAWAANVVSSPAEYAACPVCLVGTGTPPFALAFRGA